MIDITLVGIYADTKEKLAQGERIREMLKQPQYKPMPVEYQVIIIYAVTSPACVSIIGRAVSDPPPYSSDILAALSRSLE